MPSVSSNNILTKNKAGVEDPASDMETNANESDPIPGCGANAFQNIFK